MKKFILSILVLGLLFTPKIKADEIHASAMFAIPIYQLPDYPSAAIQNDNDQTAGFYCDQNRSKGLYVAHKAIGHHKVVQAAKLANAKALYTAFGRSFIVPKPSWEPNTGSVLLRGVQKGYTALQGNRGALPNQGDYNRYPNYDNGNQNAGMGKALYLVGNCVCIGDFRLGGIVHL